MLSSSIQIALYAVDCNDLIVPFDPEKHDTWDDIINQVKTVCENKFDVLICDFAKKPLKQDGPTINLLFVETHQLQSPRFFDKIPGSCLRKIPSAEDRHLNLKSDGMYSPIITISDKDFLDINTLARDIEFADQRKRYIQELKIDSRAKFLDSSIWHRYVPIQGERAFVEYLTEIITEIVYYWDMRLYYSVSAVNVLDFTLRMLLNSYVSNFGDGGHSLSVAPFKFHSEGYLNRQNEKKIRLFFQNDEDLFKTLHWKMLLVDDNALNPLSSIGGESVRVNKYDLVRQPLDRLYQALNVDARKQFELIAPESNVDVLDFCKKILKNNVIDIVLLDYLLGDRSSNLGPNSPEYGHELLLELIDDDKNTLRLYKRDFFGRFWIFPASSFPFALSDKLSQLGIGHLHSIWHLSGGGDPITTPHLYAYYFFRFIEQKINEFYLSPTSLQRLIDETPTFPDTPMGATEWALYINTSLQFYGSRLEAASHYAKHRGEYSPFMASVCNFMMEEVNIIKLLKQIIGLTNIIANPESAPDHREKSVAELETLLHNEYPEYMLNLESFIKRAKRHNDPNLLAAIKYIDEHPVTSLSLDLHGRSLESLPDTIRKFKNLESISIRNNKLKELPFFLTELTKIRHLDLSKNVIEDLSGLSIIGKLEHLHTVYIAGNPISEKIDENYHIIINDPMRVRELVIWMQANPLLKSR